MFEEDDRGGLGAFGFGFKEELVALFEGELAELLVVVFLFVHLCY